MDGQALEGRRAVIGLVIGLCIALLLAGIAWAYHVRVWLVDEYREGYQVGQALPTREFTTSRLCNRSVESKYGAFDVESLQVPLTQEIPDDAWAYLLGCYDADDGRDYQPFPTLQRGYDD